MSTASPRSRDEYEVKGEEDTIRERVNTDNNIDTNLTNLDGEEDRVDTDQLLSHAIIETVQYEDFVKHQGNGVKIVEIEEEEGENVENIEIIELDDDDEEEEDSPPQAKRSRTEPSDTQLKMEQAITVTLQCPQVDCLEMMATDEFNDHMLKQHSIGLHRCLIKDCAQSFNHKHFLSEHIKQSHQSTTELHCGQCSRHYSSYNRLSNHNIQQHQFGYFQCAFPLCPFAGIHKRNVHDHYRNFHKTPLTLLKCDYPAGCEFQTRIAFYLKQHQRVHSGAKPFKCSWPECEFAAAQRYNTIRHICSMHLKADPDSEADSVSNGTQLSDVKDYVEVVRELL